MGIINFEKAPTSYREVLAPGHICRAPISFSHIQPVNEVRLRWLNKDKPPQSEYEFASTDLANYQPKTDLRHLGLDSDSFLVAVPYKFRPCILVSDPSLIKIIPSLAISGSMFSRYTQFMTRLAI